VFLELAHSLFYYLGQVNIVNGEDKAPAVQQSRCSRPSSAAAVLPVWSPAATASGLSRSTMSSSVPAGHQPSSPMSSAALPPSLSVAADRSTSLRSTSAAPTTTPSLPSTTVGHCSSPVTPAPPPVHAVSTLRCSRTSSTVAADSLCSHDVQQSAVHLDSSENSLINDLLADSLVDNSIVSTVSTDISSDMRSPGTVVQLDSEPDSFSFDNSDVSNYHITDLFSNSFTNQCSTPVEHTV